MAEQGSEHRRRLEEQGERQARLEEDPAMGAGGEGGRPGRAGGNLARKVGTRDEQKRAFERPAGSSRVRKRDEQES